MIMEPRGLLELSYRVLSSGAKYELISMFRFSLFFYIARYKYTSSKLHIALDVHRPTVIQYLPSFWSYKTRFYLRAKPKH